MKLDQLSLYSAPQRNLRYVEPSIGFLEQGVTSARHASQPALTWTQGVYSSVKPKVDKAVQMGKDGYVYLQNPPPEFYPRAGVIGFAGILGLFLARGSRVKRLLYPSVLTGVAASMYYPQEAAEIAKATGDSIYDWAIQAYVTVETQLFKPKAPKPQAEKSASEETKA
ncbi:apolipoprotein O, a isoform X2 [Engraulis encrasicolus]